VFCDADCDVDEPEHADDCPSTTGVFPVREQDLDRCGNCGHPRHGFCCVDCGAELRVGDHYMHRQVEDADPLLPGLEGVAVYEVICIGCAAGEAFRRA
jgi:hypothetical protein